MEGRLMLSLYLHVPRSDAVDRASGKGLHCEYTELSFKNRIKRTSDTPKTGIGLVH